MGRVLSDAGALQNEEAILRGQTGAMPRTQGLDRDEFRRALLARATETTRLVRGTTVQENLAAGAELRTILGGPAAAIEHLPAFQTVAQALARASGGDPDRMSADLGRAMSLRGSFDNPITGAPDPERGRRELDMAGRMMFAFRGRGVNPQEVNMFQRRARGAGERMAPEAYWSGWTASLIQGLSGNVAGTALNAFSRQMVNGIMPTAQADFLKQHGLLAPNARGARVPEREIRSLLQRGEIDDEEAGRLRTGAASRFNRRHIVNSDLAAVRPDLFFDWMVRHLESRGIRTQDERDAFANAAGATNTGRQLWSFGLNPAAIRADTAAVAAVAPGALEEFLNEGYSAALGNLTAGVTNFTTALGSAATSDLIALMDKLASGLNNMAEWARANPDSARILVDVAAGLTVLATAGALFAAGSLAVSGLMGLAGAIGAGAGGLAAVAGSAAFATLVGPLGLAALAGGVVYLASTMTGRDWEDLFNSVGNGLTRLWRTLQGWAALPGQTAPGVVQPGQVTPGAGGASPYGPTGIPTPGNHMPNLGNMPGQQGALGGGFNYAAFRLPREASDATRPVVLLGSGPINGCKQNGGMIHLPRTWWVRDGRSFLADKRADGAAGAVLPEVARPSPGR